MTAHSYLEYALILLGWLINNAIWHTITATGLFALPFLFKLTAFYLKAREQGADEGDAGGLTLSWMENTVYMSLLVIMFTCVPLLDIDITQIKYDVERSKQCNLWTPAKPEQSGYAPMVNEISGKTAAVPVWWYLVHTLTNGFTNAATATLPCKPDLRQMRFEIQHTRINDPVLRQEVQDFVAECYSPSFARLKRNEDKLSEDEINDVAWLGSKWFLDKPGYYDTDHARSPRAGWSYDSAGRDAGLPDTGNGGYPTCKQWWSDPEVGLRSRVINLLEPRISRALKKLFYNEQYEEKVLRALVSPRNLNVSQGGQVYVGYGGNIDITILNQISRDAATVGHAIASFSFFPAYDTLRQALPMVQAILLMALVICIPIITLLSAYNMKVTLTLTFAQLGLNFLTFWWELARWLDSALFDLLYDSDTHSKWNWMGLQNTQDDIIMQIVMGAMFIVLPMFWIGAMGWAGIRLGSAIEGATKTGTNRAEKAGGVAGNILSNKILK